MKNNKGFTLIEMLVVIAMIGILSAVVLTALGPSRQKAQDARIISDVNQARAIAEGYYNPTDGTYNTVGIGNDTAFLNSVKDANNNYGGTKNCNSQALCMVATSNGSAFAIYGELNIGQPNTWFCSDSAGKTEQATITGAPTLTNCP